MKRNCAVSGVEFEIFPEDKRFYAKMGVPAPMLCPAERTRRRWSWRGKNFFLRACDGCGKKTMSSFSPRLAGVVAYCEECYRSDKSDATVYGRDFDFSRPFFEQFAELLHQVPRHISNTTQNENCEYVISSSRNKNCYMTDETDESRDCLFGYTYQRVKDIVSSIYVHDSELGYELLNAENCYRVFFSENVYHCSDSAFLLNCRSCACCLFCSNLRNKSYYIFNKPAAKAEYLRLWQEVFSGSHTVLQGWRAKFEFFLGSQPVPAAVMVNTESCSGNLLTNCKNVLDSFSVDNSQDCRYCSDLHHSRDVYDVNIYEGELMYECNHAGPKGYRNLFSQLVWWCSDVYYCVDSFYLHDCFGCVGLKKEEYCVLNKRMSRPEYEKLVRRVIEHMTNTGEWGEFFPSALSPHPYNHSMAQRFYPLSKDQVAGKEWLWLDEEDELEGAVQKEVPDQLPEDGRDLLREVFVCGRTGRKFKFIAQELEFYRKHSLPFPRLAPMARIEALWAKIGMREVRSGACSRCSRRILTSQPPLLAGGVVCADCYLRFVG